MEDLTQEEKKVQEVEEIAPEETFDAENTENAPEDEDDQARVDKHSIFHDIFKLFSYPLERTKA